MLLSLSPPQLGENSKIIEESKALKKVGKGGLSVCTACRDQGKPLWGCLRTLTPGQTSNHTKHYTDQHPDLMAELKRKEEDANAIVSQCKLFYHLILDAK